MRERLFLAAIGAGALALSACAKTTPVEGAPSPSATTNTAAPSAGARWSANIQSVTQNRADVGQSTRDRSYGTATWTVGAAPSLTNMNMVFTYAGAERTLAWAIIPGSCGNPALPVVPMSNFPELNVGGGGRAQVTTSLPITLPSSGSYHIDIYRDRRAGPESLVACGNLRYAAG